MKINREQLINYEMILSGRLIKLFNHLTKSLIHKDIKYKNRVKKIISSMEEIQKKVKLKLNETYKELLNV